MPGLVMEPRNIESFIDFSRKESLTQQGSPISLLSPRSDSLDLAIDGVIVDTSIEQLYMNVFEMQSSDQSPSRASFFSYGEESRIDSELRHLVGDLEDVEVTKEVVVEKKHNNEEEEEESKIVKVKTVSFRPEPSLKTEPLRPKDQSPDIGGPFLLKQAKDMINLGENPQRTLEVAQRAMRAFKKPSLDQVMCLQVLAVSLSNLGRYEEAILMLERSIEITVIEDGEDHALAKFAGCMQLGDTYAMAGQTENSLLLYSAGLEIQRQVLGERDPRFGETCRFVAEVNVQALRFNEAERLCQKALQTRVKNGSEPDPDALLEEAADRRLMGMICDSRGDFEASLEHYILAGVALASSGGQELGVALVDRSVGDTYLALSQYDEAVIAYKKSLAVFKALRGQNHPEVASVFVRLGDLYNKVGQFKESKTYCENALKIYNYKNHKTAVWEDVACGLVELSAIYQSMDELDRALKLLERALRMFSEGRGTNNTLAGIETQIGVIHYMMGSFDDSYRVLKSSVFKFRASSEKKSALFAVTLNQMGLVCVRLYSINEAAELFEEAKDVFEKEHGPFHPDTLGVYSNLAGTYDAMGRLEDAIEILEYVVGIREKKLGSPDPEVEDEKWRLSELLKEAGRGRNRKARSLETTRHQ